jgi:hypothetical protein
LIKINIVIFARTMLSRKLTDHSSHIVVMIKHDPLVLSLPQIHIHVKQRSLIRFLQMVAF